MTYEGRTWREGKFWVVEVRGVGVTQARRLSQVEEMARDLVAIVAQVPAGEVAVEITARGVTSAGPPAADRALIEEMRGPRR